MNSYFVIPMHTDIPLSWNPHDPTDLPVPECDYFGKVISVYDRLLAHLNLTVYVDFNHRVLPKYGRDVVVFALGDEWGRYPAYAHRVAAVFKCMGTSLWRPRDLPAPNALGFMELSNYLRLSIFRAPSAIRYWLTCLKYGRRASIMTVPLGTYRQLERPMINIAKRRYDAYFGGSMTQRQTQGFSIKRWLKAPKTLSRIEMGEQLKRFAVRHPNRRIATNVTLGFHDATLDEVTRYSDAMMEAKIAIVPRGTSFETFRWYEALRAGCVIVGEPVPPWQFYEGSPMVTVRDWRDLELALEQILSDPTRLQKLHDDGIAWWHARCSPEAVGKQAAAFTKTSMQ